MAAAVATTTDAFLGGRVECVQPDEGHHRSGLDAVLLAAALPAATRGMALDLGAGAGVAGLCAAARCADLSVTLIEREAELVRCAEASLRLPANRNLVGRVKMERADIAALPDALRESADEVICNPPFHDGEANSASPKAGRAGAHVLAAEGLDPWLRAAATVLRPRGRLTLIFRADGLDAVLAALARRFGAVDVLPIHPRANLPAGRVLVAGRKGRRAAMRLLPPLVLHGEDGKAFLPPVDAILRNGAALGDVHPPWQGRR
ncbi:MAG: methyltransferase [Rhizobiales bacterium]|nr:methyltransferase [Hyphomicrobiales bacterium]MBN9010143.1 methyltransferase [Hyphomicrobiales bacterium]